jgi:methionine aminotransferase
MIKGSLINSKLPQVGTTIFTVMSKLANEHNAINLSQGFPDYSCSQELVSLIHKNMLAGNNQYAPMPGLLSLREVISKKMGLVYEKKYDAETEITITAGATQAIFTAISTIVNPGDEVIIFEPAYDCYAPAIELYGGKVVPITLQFPNYTIDWKEVAGLINTKTRAIIINNPNNPTSSVFDKNDLLQLENIVRNTNIVIISDEVYEHLIFDGAQHQSVAAFKGLAERCFIVFSFGKTYHATGWKIGYCLAPKELMNEFRKIHQFNVFCVNNPIQQALAEYLNKTEDYLTLPNFFQEKRDFFVDKLNGSRFTVYPSKGTYFQLLGYEKISNENDVAFAERLIKEFKVASIPLSVFYNKKDDNKVLRFCFAKKNETLLRAAEILKSI